MRFTKILTAIVGLLAMMLVVTSCGKELSEGDKLELLNGQTPATGHTHDHHSTQPTVPPSDGSDPNPAPDTGVTGVNGSTRLPSDYQGCAWYHDVSGTTVCVPDPLPKNVTGAKACDYLRQQGYGPLTVLDGANKGKKSDDPLALDDNGDGVGCFGGDFGSAAAPPESSGGGIVPE